MKIERFVLGPIETNCYVVVNEDTKECFAVDMAYCPKAYVDHICLLYTSPSPRD